MQTWSSSVTPSRAGHGRSGTKLMAWKGILGLAALVGGILSSGCAHNQSGDATLSSRIAEVACVSRCKGVQDSCNADARFDYRQCQAGYSEAFRDYRWCLASAVSRSECGYPWWPCAENLYGYCANRAAECERACRTGGTASTL